MEFVLAGQAWLGRRGCSVPRLDAELLLAHLLGVDRLRLYLDHDRPLTPAEQDRYRELLMARAAGRPLAYLTGRREFYGLTFAVDPRVLIPRPESELLVEQGLDALPSAGPCAFADVGTGSGCLAVSLAVHRKEARGVAIDREPDALALARENVERHGVADRVRCLEGDLLAPLGKAEGGLDLVVANPPYVEPGDPRLAAEVAGHEPAAALYAVGESVPDLYRRLAAQAAGALKPGGRLLLECGEGQAESLAAVVEATLPGVEIIPDLAGIPRVLAVTRR